MKIMFILATIVVSLSIGFATAHEEVKPQVIETPVIEIVTTEKEYVAVTEIITPSEEIIIDDSSLKEPWWTNEEYELICKVIMAEVGSDTISDEAQHGATAVILNRMNHKDFPDTIHDVIYQPNVYACTGYLGSVTPTERVRNNVLAVLNGDVIIPDDVVWQAGFPQAAWNCSVEVYKHYDAEPYDIWLCHYGTPK